MSKYEIELTGGEQAVLLLHGLTGNPFEMKFLADKLHKKGFSVYAPCLPGHNETIEVLKQTPWQEWYRGAREAYLHLKETHEQVGVAGLCMGAVLALELAAEFPEIPAVSLMSTTLFYDGWTIPWYSFLIPLVYCTPLKYFYSFTERPPYGIKNDRLRSIVLKNASEMVYDRVPGLAMDQNFRLINHVKSHLQAVTAPILLLHAREDDTASLKNAEYVEQHVGSTSIRKVILEESYHMITVDTDRHLVAKENIEFFTTYLRQNC
ncbi:MAG: alpha/beta fold hydrolase [Sporomusaceae bacterium]|nr:alpha/beta fold hydrolase [Sporomusaceae bacterium]